MVLNALMDSFLPQSEKCGTERVNCNGVVSYSCCVACSQTVGTFYSAAEPSFSRQYSRTTTCLIDVLMSAASSAVGELQKKISITRHTVHFTLQSSLCKPIENASAIF